MSIELDFSELYKDVVEPNESERERFSEAIKNLQKIVTDNVSDIQLTAGDIPELEQPILGRLLTTEALAGAEQKYRALTTTGRFMGASGMVAVIDGDAINIERLEGDMTVEGRIVASRIGLLPDLEQEGVEDEMERRLKASYMISLADASYVRRDASGALIYIERVPGIADIPLVYDNVEVYPLYGPRAHVVRTVELGAEVINTCSNLFELELERVA